MNDVTQDTHQDRAFLEREYNARAMTSDFDKDAIYLARSAIAFSKAKRIADLVYDEKSGSKLDIYPAGPGTPLFVWIHGGYWRASSKNENAFVAPGLVASGVSVASVDYTLAPAASLDEIVRQVRASIAWLHRAAPRYGYDARRIHIGGHSAGGHLVGMLLADNWHEEFGLPSHIIGTALSVSGLFDLQPLRNCFVNDALGLDAEAASRNSPIKHLPQNSDATLLVTVGGDESSEFKRQSDIYMSAWLGKGHSGRLIDMPDRHHFDIILELERAGNPLFDGLLQSIKSC